MRTLSSSTIGIAIVAFWLMGCGLTAAVGAPGHYPNNSGPIILSNMNGMQAYILPIGATIQRLIVPDQRGMAEDIVLGFDDATQYQVRFWQSTLTTLALPHPTIPRPDIKGPGLI